MATRDVRWPCHSLHTHLGCTDVGGGLVTADMLLARLHGHAQRSPALGIHAHTNDAACISASTSVCVCVCVPLDVALVLLPCACTALREEQPKLLDTFAHEATQPCALSQCPA
eukprot:1151812-Pelagomonas_calceolata.AAC.2